MKKRRDSGWDYIASGMTQCATFTVRLQLGTKIASIFLLNWYKKAAFKFTHIQEIVKKRGVLINDELLDLKMIADSSS